MHEHAIARLDLTEPFALVVEQVHRDPAGHVNHDLPGARLGTFLLNRPQHVHRAAFGAAHMAEATAMHAGDEAGFGEAGAQPLAAHFHQAEMADGANLDAGAVVLQRVLQPPFDHAVMLAAFHVDVVDDDEAGEIAKAQLPGDFLGRLQIGPQRGFLDAAFPRRSAGVHVDRHQRFGLVDHQIAAGFELHGGGHHGIQLRINSMSREQGLPAIGLLVPGHHFFGVRRHQHAHEVARCLPAVLAIDQNFLHVARIHIADRPFDQAGFLIDQRRRHRCHRGFADIVPQAHQIFAVPLDFGLGARRTSGPHNQPHALRHFHFRGDFLQAPTVGG